MGDVVAQRRSCQRGQAPSVTPRVERTRPPVRGSARLAGVPLPLWGGSRTTLPSARNRSPNADTTPPAYASMHSRCTHDALTARSGGTRARDHAFRPNIRCLAAHRHAALRALRSARGCLVPRHRCNRRLSDARPCALRMASCPGYQADLRFIADCTSDAPELPLLSQEAGRILATNFPWAHDGNDQLRQRKRDRILPGPMIRITIT